MNSTEIMRTIHSIAATSSRSEKLSKLATVPSTILKYTYHPHIKFYIRPGVIVSGGIEGDDFSKNTWRILDLLATGKFRGRKGLNLYRTYASTLNPMSAELFYRIINKDLRCGVSIKSVDKVFPGLVPTEFCMLCEELDEKRLTYPCYVSPKIDGDRAIFKHEEQKIYSRSGREIKGLDHIIKALSLVQFDLDGELRDWSVPFPVSSGGLRSSKVIKAPYFYHVFDVVSTSLPFWDRYNLLCSLVPYVGTAPVCRVPHYKCTSRKHVEIMYRKFLELRYEGTVIKTRDHMYEFRRSFSWMRMVPEKSVDLNVLGWKTGTGKNTSRCAKLIVNYKGHVQRVGTGINEEQSISWFDDPSLIVGKTIQVNFKEETNHGKMRQPRFAGIRYDK